MRCKSKKQCSNKPGVFMIDDRTFLVKIFHPLFVVFSYMFLYLPIVTLVIFSFNDSFYSVKWAGFSFRWYRELLATPEILQATQTSLIVALSATVLTVLMGSALVFASKWWRHLWPFTLFQANVLFPEIIIAIGLLSLFSMLRIPVGYGSLIAGHTLLGLGFVVPIIRARFHELDPHLTEASADLGATNVQTFWKVVLPLLMPSLIASALLVFTLSLDDFLIAFFCSGTKIMTLSVYVYSLVREGVNPTVNAISTCLLVLSSVFILIISSLKVLDQIIGND